MAIIAHPSGTDRTSSALYSEVRHESMGTTPILPLESLFILLFPSRYQEFLDPENSKFFRWSYTSFVQSSFMRAIVFKRGTLITEVAIDTSLQTAG